MFTLRGAGKTAQPPAQEALNSGFTKLTERQAGELVEIRAETKAQLEEQDRRHRRELQDLREEQDRAHRREMENLRVDLMRRINEKVEQEHNRLKQRIHHLEAVLEGAGIAIPPWTALEEGDVVG